MICEPSPAVLCVWSGVLYSFTVVLGMGCLMSTPLPGGAVDHLL